MPGMMKKNAMKRGGQPMPMKRGGKAKKQVMKKKAKKKK